MNYEEIKVSIYTQAFNTSRYLTQCIESVLNQTHKNFEYTIIDNGSTDSTRQIIQEYTKKDSRIRLVCFNENARARIKQVSIIDHKGKYVTVLDSDDWWAPNYLETLIAFAEANDLDIACGTTCLYFDETGEQYPLFTSGPEPVVFCRAQFCYEIQNLVDHFSSAWNKLIKKEVWDKVFSLDLPPYAGPLDVVLGLRFICNSSCIGIENTILYFYRRRNGSSGTSFDKTFFDAILFLNDEFNGFLKIGDILKNENKYIISDYFLSELLQLFLILEDASVPLEEKELEHYRMLTHSVTKKIMQSDDYIIWLNKKFLIWMKNMTVSMEKKEKWIKFVLKNKALLDNAMSVKAANLLFGTLMPNCYVAVTGQNAELFLTDHSFIKKIVNDETAQMLYNNHYRVYSMLFGRDTPLRCVLGIDSLLFGALLQDDSEALLYRLKALARRKRIAKRYGLKEAIVALCKQREDANP